MASAPPPPRKATTTARLLCGWAVGGFGFVVVLLGLPLLNYFAPGLMAVRVGGFTLSWLVLGVLFFPFVWVISGVFIRKSLRMESEEAEGALAENRKRASRRP